jgi:parallel beta-helix repeat protein
LFDTTTIATVVIHVSSVLLMLRLSLFGLLAFAAFSSPAANATEFIVDQRNPGASDANAGTREKPFKTISAAASKVKAGDQVIVHGGDYREAVTITSSGTASAPIVIEAAPGETPVIKGSDIITGWERESGPVWKATLKRPPPRDISGKNPTYWDTNDVRQVFIRDGTLFDAQRLQRVQKRDAMKEDTFFCDVAASTLYVWLPDSASPVEHPPEASVRGAWLYVNANHVIIRGLQMRHASTTSITNWPACNLAGDHITLENCFISWGDFVGLSMSGTGNTVRNSVIACNGNAGLGGTGERHTIEGCRVVYNDIDRYSPEWHAGGAKLIPNFRHGSIRHNEFAHNFGPGLWLDAGCDENVIDGNLAHDNEGAGIMVEVSRGNLLINNICYANRNDLSGPYRYGDGAVKERIMSEVRVAPSRLLNIYHAGDGRGIYISTAPETMVLHNTAYLNEGEGICVESPPRVDGAITWETRGGTVANNIIVFNNGSQLTLRPVENPEKKITSDHNLLFALGAILAKYGWEGPLALSLPEWRKISGQDTHSIDADPRFALTVMEDFRVLPNSAALGAGKPFPQADHDFFGHPRGKDKTTIGACEKPAENYPQPAWQSLSEAVRSGHR